MQGASGKQLAAAWWAPVLLCMIAFGLRLGPLWVNRFHPDEALYASWALNIAYGRDVWLMQAALDKPPLLFYLMAGAFFVLGHIEVAARLIGLMASTISVALTWQLGIGMRIPAHVPTIVMALSPFAILFAPTAFLDPLMVMWVLASLVAIARKQPGWAGAWLGLATATKVQALVFLPLIAAMGLIVSDQRFTVSKRFTLGLAVPLVAVLAWDRLRGGTPFWIQQTINYGGIRLIYPGEVLPRLMGWTSFLPHWFGWPLLVMLAIGLPLLLIHELTHNRRTLTATLDLLLMTFALGYFFLHWLLAFPIWDRYLLGLVPVLCLLIGRLASLSINWLAKRIPQAASLTVATLIFAMLIVPAAQASRSVLPMGGDHGSQDGIERVAGYLRAFPYGTVAYDHWLGWSLRYYLWDATTYIAYFATPETLAEDLRVFGRTSPRFIVFPSSESTARIERAIAVERFALSPVLATQDRHGQPTFTLYRIDSNGNR